MQIDLSKNEKFKNQTINLTKDTNESIVFTGDIENQIEYYEKGNNIEIKTYGLLSIRYVKAVCKGRNDGYSVTYYVYNPETKKYTKAGSQIRHDGWFDGTYYCKVWANAKGMEVQRSYELLNTCIERSETDFNNRTAAYFNDNGKTIYNDKQYMDWQNPLGTITLKNAGKNGIANVAKISYQTNHNGNIGNLLTANHQIGEGAGFVSKVNKSGTYLNETISGGNNNDILKGVGGTNTIIGNDGDDKLYSGKGADTFYFQTGNADSNTGDIIYSADNLDTIEFHSLNNSGKQNFNMSEIEMYKEKNNLIIIAPSKDSDGDSTREKVIVNNFYKTKDENKIKNLKITGTNAKTGTIDKDGNLKYDSSTTQVKELVSGKGTLKGSDADNTFSPTGKSTMITGGGNDTIYLSDLTDTINVTGSGTKTIKYETYSGDSQIINIKDKTAIVNFTFDDSINPAPVYFRRQNDLILEWKHKTRNWYYTAYVKNYYTDSVDKSKIKINGTVVSITNLSLIGTNGKDTFELDKTTNYTVYPTKGNDKVVINGGTGTKNLKFMLFCGNNTIEFAGEKQTGEVHIEVMASEYYDYNFVKDGNNLLLRLGFINYKGVFVTKNTQTFKDFFTSPYAPDETNTYFVEAYDDGDEPTSTMLRTYLNNKGLAVNGIYNRKERRTEFTGTDHNEIFSGNKNPKYITTGGGNDKIYLGKGNDNVIINGSGTKTVYINKNEGTDTIDMQNVSATVNFVFGSGYRYSYSDEGGNRILNRIYDNGKKFITEQTIIKNYNDGKLQINGVVKNNANTPVVVEKDFKAENNYEVKSGKNELVLLGQKADTVVSNGNNAEIFAGAGNDTITINNGTSYINSGKGDDEIIINSTSDTSFYFAAGDGNDTISFSKLPTNPANTYFDIDFKGLFGNTYIPMANALKSGKMKFTKKGNDLIFTKLATRAKTETITIKDYFKAGNENLKNMTIHSADLQSFGFENETIQGTINYKYGLAGYIFGTSYIFGLNIESEMNGYNTAIYTGVADYNNVYTYNGKGKAEMRSVANAGIDTYQVKLGAKSELTIKDPDGNKDALILNNSKGSLSLFFNVTKDRKIVHDELYIFNKGSLNYGNMAAFYGGRNSTGYIEIDEFFESGTSYDSYTMKKGSGYIEDVILAKDRYAYNNKDVAMTHWINAVGEAVAGWLDNHTEYASTEAVLNSNNKKDITSLLKVYQGNTASKFV